MCRFACRNDLFGHLLCESLVYAFLLMCFISQCHSGTALDVCMQRVWSLPDAPKEKHAPALPTRKPLVEVELKQ